MSKSVIGWIVPLVIWLGFTLAGLLINGLVLKQLKRWASKSTWQLDNLFLNSLGNAVVVWMCALGAYIATFNLPVTLTARVSKSISDTLFVITALSVTLVLSRLAVGLFGFYAVRFPGVLPSTSIFGNLVRMIVMALGILIVLQSVGISITPILTALGVGGLAVALALQDTLSNLFSGFQIIVSRQFQPGDYIKLGTGEEGYVRDIAWRNTTIETLGAFTVVVPNSKLATAIVTNYHQPATEMALIIPASVAYDSDPEHVERVTIEVAHAILQEVEGGVSDFQPLVRFHTFGDSAILFNVILRIREFTNQYPVRHEFIKRLLVRYREEGIEIPFPQRVLHLETAREGMRIRTMTTCEPAEG
ncbi:MAG: mechanosensitive ion channel family protein [Capsulimonadales bacterium]|nr:mechanosensitive ion channel family protein [Capsulimonadales bacterium]